MHEITTENMVLTARVAMVSQLGILYSLYFWNIFPWFKIKQHLYKILNQPSEAGVIISVFTFR